MTLAKMTHRIGREPENSSAVRNTAKEYAREERQPAAHSPLGQPDRREEGSGKWEKPRAAGPTPPQLGEGNDGHDEDRKNHPATNYREKDRAGKNSQLQQESERASHFVVSLSDSLRPEVSGAGRQAQYVCIEKDGFSAAGGEDGANKLEILEHCVAVVAFGREQARAKHAERARPVATSHPIEKHSSRVPAGVPGERIEVVLRAHDLRITERLSDAPQRDIVVVNIIVRDDEPLVAGEANPGQHIPDFAHRSGELWFESDVTHDASPARSVSAEDFR